MQKVHDSTLYIYFQEHSLRFVHSFLFFGTLKALNAAALHSWLPCTQAHQAFHCLRPGAVPAALQEVRSQMTCDYQQVAQAGLRRGPNSTDITFFSLLTV